MFATSDSLVYLREHMRRSPNAKQSESKRLLPFEELRKQVEAKRRRTSVSQPKKNSVSFNFQDNQVYHRHLSDEDLSNAWLMGAESNQIKKNLYRTVSCFRHGILDHSNDTIRGLEVHANPDLMKKKIMKNRQVVGLILKQQSFLKGAMGKANEHVLSCMSQKLSVEDCREAQQAGALDADEATLLHAFSLAQETYRKQQWAAESPFLALHPQPSPSQDLEQPTVRRVVSGESVSSVL